MLGVAGEETMMRRAIAPLIVIALGLTMSGVAIAGDPTVETVVSFDPAKGELPEGLAITDRGVTYVGFAPTGQIVKVADDGSVSPVATLPNGQGFLVGLAVDGRNRLFAALASFDDTTHGIWRVRSDGSAKRVVPLPTDTFPNAIAFRGRRMFVTDSFGGAVWRIRHGDARIWAQDDILLGDLTTDLPIGANGLAFLGRYLYVTNDQKGRIVRIPVESGGQAGSPVLLTEDDALVGADGIAFDVRGNLYVAVNEQDKLVRMGPSGGMTTLATRADGLDFPATPVFGERPAHTTDLYLTNFALDLDRHPNPALLVLDVGVAGKRLP
jgi:sugar lactone lactonase YvrE